MKKKRYSIVLGFVFLSISLGQEKSPVTVSAWLDPDAIRAGEVLNVFVTATSEPQFHIFAVNKIAEGPIPSKITIEGKDIVEVVGVAVEPEPIKKFDEGFLTDIYYHEGSVTFETPVKISSSLEPGTYSLTAKLLYQACDPTICYPPRTEEFELSFAVVPGETRVERTAITVATVSFSDDDNINLDAVIAQGVGSFILLALSMGLLALLTPCVYPMIPITVSYFTKQGEMEGQSPWKKATVYSLGIIITYTILGLFLTVIAGAAGTSQLAANPWMNLFIGGLFVFFALSLFGMYEIQLPASLRHFSLRQEGRGGYVGTLFMALTFTLVSFTCTVQFVGLLLVRAMQGDWFWPVLGLLFFSGALALPFFFLALFPQYLARMPKSGGWLNSVKVVMGFLVLAAAFKFLSNTDLIWNWGFFTRPVVLAAWVMIVLFAGLYLIGKLRLPHDTPLKTVGVPRMLISLFLLTFAIYLARGLVGQPLHGLIDVYLPSAVKGEIWSIAEAGKPENYLRWTMDFDEGLGEAEQTDKPIFLNFTGYTCTNCRWMESNMFTKPQVIERLKRYVLVELFTDGGPNKDENQRMEINRFGTAAIPFYVILSPDNLEIARFPGLTRNKEKFLEFLDKGLDKRVSIIYAD